MSLAALSSALCSCALFHTQSIVGRVYDKVLGCHISRLIMFIWQEELCELATMQLGIAVLSTLFAQSFCLIAAIAETQCGCAGLGCLLVLFCWLPVQHLPTHSAVQQSNTAYNHVHLMNMWQIVHLPPHRYRSHGRGIQRI